jgi:ankyrin repeat protein
MASSLRTMHNDEIINAEMLEDMLLRRACSSGNHYAIACLLEMGVNVNARGWRKCETALMNAAQHGLADVVELLVTDYHADINQIDRTGETALHRCLVKPSVQCLTTLLALKAKVDFVGSMGLTPLEVAVEKQLVECVDVLLAARANVDRVYNNEALVRLLSSPKINARTCELLRLARRRKHADVLCSWMLALAPLELPICE